jgi:hypothetical protein
MSLYPGRILTRVWRSSRFKFDDFHLPAEHSAPVQENGELLELPPSVTLKRIDAILKLVL